MSRNGPQPQAILRWVQNSLRVKLTLGVVIPLVIVLGLFSIVEQRRHQQAMLQNLSIMASQSGRIIEASLRHSMLESDFSEVQNILNTINLRNEFRVIHLLDTNGRIVFAPFGIGENKLLDKSQEDCLICHRLESGLRPASVVVRSDDGQSVFRSMYPIKNSQECSGCHDPANNLIGLLLIDIPVATTEAVLETHLRENLLWWISAILASIIIVNVATSRIVIRPIKRLSEAMRNLGKNQEISRLPEVSYDEIGQLTSSFNEMSQRIEDETQHNQLLSDDLQRQSDQRGEILKRLITAQEDERARIARELHDDLGQMLSALHLQIELVERQVISRPQIAMEQLVNIRAMITEAIDHMYQMIIALRPSTLDDLGLVAALKSHAERFLGESGIAFELEVSNLNDRMDKDIEIALYRIFQEAMNNIYRHSGASKVKIQLGKENGNFVGVIQDNGKGFDPNMVGLAHDNRGGYGLLGIQERVAQLCGEFRLESKPGLGTSIFIRIPIQVSDD